MVARGPDPAVALLGGLGLGALALWWWRSGNQEQGGESVSNAKGFPGYATSDLGALEPMFRATIEEIIQDLEGRGWRVKVRETYRDATRQAAYYAAGWSTIDGVTRKSRHNYVDASGRPAAEAVDLGPDGAADDAEAARFYADLRDLAVASGLESGANYSRSSARWAAFGLGWDPGHVET